MDSTDEQTEHMSISMLKNFQPCPLRSQIKLAKFQGISKQCDRTPTKKNNESLDFGKKLDLIQDYVMESTESESKSDAIQHKIARLKALITAHKLAMKDKRERKRRFAEKQQQILTLEA